MCNLVHAGTLNDAVIDTRISPKTQKTNMKSWDTMDYKFKECIGNSLGTLVIPVDSVTSQ